MTATIADEAISAKQITAADFDAMLVRLRLPTEYEFFKNQTGMWAFYASGV